MEQINKYETESRNLATMAATERIKIETDFSLAVTLFIHIEVEGTAGTGGKVELKQAADDNFTPKLVDSEKHSKTLSGTDYNDVIQDIVFCGAAYIDITKPTGATGTLKIKYIAKN